MFTVRAMTQWYKESFGKTDPIPPEFTIVKQFAPKEDITAYEAAYILGKVTGLGSPFHEIGFTPEKWDNLEPRFKRHFKDKDNVYYIGNVEKKMD